MTQLSWTNNLLILQGTKTIEEKEFYIRLCIKNNYSKRELARQIESHYYERYLLSDGNALESLEPVVGEEDQPNTRLLDIYELNVKQAYDELDVFGDENIYYYVIFSTTDNGRGDSVTTAPYYLDNVNENDHILNEVYLNISYDGIVSVCDLPPNQTAE